MVSHETCVHGDVGGMSGFATSALGCLAIEDAPENVIGVLAVHCGIEYFRALFVRPFGFRPVGDGDLTRLDGRSTEAHSRFRGEHSIHTPHPQ